MNLFEKINYINLRFILFYKKINYKLKNFQDNKITVNLIIFSVIFENF